MERTKKSQDNHEEEQIRQLTEIKTVRYWYENRQISAIKSRYRYTYTYFGHFIYKKDGTE